MKDKCDWCLGSGYDDEAEVSGKCKKCKGTGKYEEQRLKT